MKYKQQPSTDNIRSHINTSVRQDYTELDSFQ